MGGDKNQLNVKPLLDSIPKLRQMNFKPTYKGRCIDIILSNVTENYGIDHVYEAIKPDDPSKGKPSDHDPAIVHSFVSIEDQAREYKVVRF